MQRVRSESSGESVYCFASFERQSSHPEHASIVRVYACNALLPSSVASSVSVQAANALGALG